MFELVIHDNCDAKENAIVTVGIIGLGFVGLPLSLLFADNGFKVIGIDSDESKIEKLNNGVSYLPDITNQELQEVITTSKIKGTVDYDIVETLDVIIVCVPTPLTSYKTPNLSYLKTVGEELAPRIRKGQLIILESSTFPGTTKEVFQPILEKNGLKAGEDFFLAYSPERIDPGNKHYKVSEVPKIVSGVSSNCLQKICNLYKKVFQKIVPVSSTQIAEFTKLLENAYRFINISFINELAILSDTMEIDLWEAINAASTKPYGFTPFYPGPGIGGHCIPVDPLYLAWKSNQCGFDNKMIRLSDEINDLMIDYIVQKIKNLLFDKSSKRVLIYGVTYKKDINDIRESPAIKIMHLLLQLGIEVSYHDPYVPEMNISECKYTSISLTENTLQQSDCVVILTDHSNIPLDKILGHANLVYDVRNVTNRLKSKAKVIRFGGGEG
ncbi:nucleotide sugar dehydrogenase [Bacillus sp. JJ1521]|uniref:nucleotide sugar dehydrogenase n=1 Tax=Bacillus sp. JJ1521 TaxID=3122957 RepID=UPI002FFE935D